MKYFFVLLAALATEPWKPGKPLVTVEPEARPFWVAKEKVRKKMLDQRAVVVSVTSRPSQKPKQKELYIQGAGVSETPPEFTFAQAQQFEDFPKMSSYVKEAKWDAKAGILFMHTEAFGYGARLRFYVDIRDQASPKEIRFLVFEGVFKGMSGVIRIEDIERRKSQISMTALYQFDKLPMPKFFVEFGIEVALRIMASKMRSFIEQKWKDGGLNDQKQKSS